MRGLFVESTTLEALSRQLRAMLATGPPGSEIRAWVPGCGSGEDAYAATILLQAEVARTARPRPIKVFATDDDPTRLAAARSEVYPRERLSHLAPNLRTHGFRAVGEEAHIAQGVRDCMIFASHRLLVDAPFARLDLIICRELFTTLSGEERAEALRRFFAALRPGGLLLLGATPPLAVGARFRIVDHRERLYMRPRVAAQARPHAAPLAERAVGAPPPEALPPALIRPPRLIVDTRHRIRSAGPGCERFLRLSGEVASYDVREVIRPELREALTTTLARAARRGRAAESRPVRLIAGDTAEVVTVVVQPRHDADEPHLEILFDAVAAGSEDDEAAPGLGATLDALQTRHTQALARSESATEELRAANEELRIFNEELRAATQELEARREELQLLNEELVTANQAQQQTLVALRQTNADLHNLMASTEIGMIFLDRELRLQRYTAPAQTLFHLLPGDLGRPLAHLSHQLRYDELLDDARRLVAEATPVEREVAHADGRWLLARLLPYRAADQRSDGVVMIFLDITGRRRAEEGLRRAKDELERRVEERAAALVRADEARQDLLRELMQAQEAERLRIARELHDTLGQQLTAALLGLRAIREHIPASGALLQRLDHVAEIVQAMGREMHEIAVNLRPTALDDVGLAGALRGYVEAWSQRTGIAAESIVAGVERHSLPPEVETAIYRIVQEALTNVVRHAAATRVSVILEGDQERVVTIIEDNGRGFDSDAVLQAPRQRGHLGLLGMRERASLAGGTLTIESAPERGTTVIVRIPLKRTGRTHDGANPHSTRR